MYSILALGILAVIWANILGKRNGKSRMYIALAIPATLVAYLSVFFVVGVAT